MDILSFQLLFNGAALGAGYGLLALGFALALRSAGAITFAHGDVAVAAAYVGVVGAALGLNGPAAAGVAITAGALLGIGVAGLSWAPFRKRPIEATFIAAIAIGIVIQNGLTAGFGGAPQAPRPLATGGVTIGDPTTAHIFMSAQALIGLGLAAGAFILVWVILTRTQLGRRMRAAAEDPEIAAAHGIPVLRLAILAFAGAGALAGLAGILLATQHYATPTGGADYILKAYMAATIAGWGRILPTAVAAMAIALFETLGAAVFSHAIAEGLLYAGFIALLAFRPQGLAGEAQGRRA